MANDRISDLPAIGTLVGGEIQEVSQPTGSTPAYRSVKAPYGGATGPTGPTGPTGATGPSGPTGATGATGATGSQGVPGPVMLMDADQGEEGMAVPGPIGPAGAAGAAGPQGAPGPMVVMDADQGEEGMPIPGPPGPAGAAGAIGAAGVPGIGMDGDQGEEGMPIPGPVGPAGAIGPQGAPGPMVVMDADQGEEGMSIPGPSGPSGAAGATGPQGPYGIGPPGLDGDPGEDGMMGPMGLSGTGGSSAATPVPLTVPDLMFWWKADALNITSGNSMLGMQNFSTALQSIFVGTGGSAAVANSALNGLPAITMPGASGGRYALSNAGFNLGQVSVFAVIKPTSFSSPNTIICGGTGAFQFRVETSGDLGMLKAAVAAIGTSSSALTASTWVQVNGTYNSSTGAYAFRSARSANGSGTSVQSISANTNGIGWNSGTAGEDFTGQFAELLVFARVLTSTEITEIETYLNGKWGV